jgi:hypothetical protein
VKLTDKAKVAVKSAAKRMKQFISIKERMGCEVEAEAKAECGDD